MKKQILMLMMVLLMINLVHSELYLWDSVTKDTAKSTTRYTASYWFDDTSESGVGKDKNVYILLWSETEQLPFNFSGVYPVSVDWCNYTIVHDRNFYNSDGTFYNYTTETTNYLFENQAFNITQLVFNMRSRDSLRVNMECHYTDPNYLYVENILVGRFFTYIPSFECDGCEKYTLEEISHQTDTQDEITKNELDVYSRIQTLISWNWNIWLIVGWIIRIGFIFLGLFLIFSGVYYFYKLFDNISKEIK